MVFDFICFIFHYTISIFFFIIVLVYIYKNALKIESFFKEIINFIYSKKGYYSLKSGLFLDHYLKIFFNYIHKELNIFIGLLFLDKYLLSRVFKKFILKISTFNIFILNFKNKVQIKNVLISVFFLILFIFSLILFVVI